MWLNAFAVMHLNTAKLESNFIICVKVFFICFFPYSSTVPKLQHLFGQYACEGRPSLMAHQELSTTPYFVDDKFVELFCFTHFLALIIRVDGIKHVV